VQRIRYGHRPTRLTRPSPQSWGYCQVSGDRSTGSDLQAELQSSEFVQRRARRRTLFLVVLLGHGSRHYDLSDRGSPRSRLSRHPLSTLALWRRSAPPRWSSAGVTATGVDAGVGVRRNGHRRSNRTCHDAKPGGPSRASSSARGWRRRTESPRQAQASPRW
jgi:hypothetical protein